MHRHLCPDRILVEQAHLERETECGGGYLNIMEKSADEKEFMLELEDETWKEDMKATLDIHNMTDKCKYFPSELCISTPRKILDEIEMTDPQEFGRLDMEDEFGRLDMEDKFGRLDME